MALHQPRRASMNRPDTLHQSQQGVDKRGYSETEAACYIGMSRSFLRQDRMDGPRAGRTTGPQYIRIGRSIRYLKEDLDAWLEAHRIERQEVAAGSAR